MPNAGYFWLSASYKEKLALAEKNFSALIFENVYPVKHSITYSFPVDAGGFVNPLVPEGGKDLTFIAFTDAEKASAGAIFTMLENMLDIDFVYDPSGNGDLRFGHQETSGASGFYASGGNTGTGNIMLDSYDGDPGGTFYEAVPMVDTYGYFTLIHEIGHALGLAHPFQGPPGAVAGPLPAKLDSAYSTVMSYDGFYADIQGPETSYMMLDILALQSIYGKSTAKNNDTYIAKGDIFVIADYGGNDTIDISNRTYDVDDVNIMNMAGGYVFYQTVGVWDINAFDYASGSWGAFQVGDASNGFFNIMIMPGSTIETVIGSSVSDLIYGAKITETIGSLGGDDRVFGGAGNDTIDGGAGEDFLVGGSGRDTLTGGSEADLFRFVRLADTRNAAADQITDFDHAQGDMIDLSKIDANSLKSGNQAFKLLTTETFSGHARELILTNGLLEGDVNGDRKADFTIALSGIISLTSADFLL